MLKHIYHAGHHFHPLGGRWYFVHKVLGICLFLRCRWYTLHCLLKPHDTGFNLLCTLLNSIRCLDHPVDGKCGVIGIVTQKYLRQNKQAIRKVSPELCTRREWIKGKAAKEYRTTANNRWHRVDISNYRIIHEVTPLRSRIANARAPICFDGCSSADTYQRISLYWPLPEQPLTQSRQPGAGTS